MEKSEINGPLFSSTPIRNGGTFRSPASPPLQPNFSSRAVQEALEHLATIDLSELVSEAKIEHCRAARDLRSCGRYVQYALNSCGHASLCAECSQRYDVCPICRIPLIKSGNNRLRLRLFDECIDAGLISRRCDERFHEKEDRNNQLTSDVQRLYSFFDVALENNLVSLICHYVTDICMDETAVSSDAVTALLLDEKVVKDWVKWTFKNMATELHRIYYLEVEEMKNRLGSLLKFSGHLASLSNVLEVLDSSFKGRLSAQLHDLRNLQKSILKTKQHLEITIWCIRHQFLEDVRSRHADFTSWRNHVRDRKSAAIARAWPPPELLDPSADSTGQGASLFIEDALENLDIYEEMGEESDFAFLQKNGALSFFQSKIGGIAGCYPFESLRAAVDILFLRGASDLVVAKQAIFVYYLFDRHWRRPEEEWRDIIDDFASSFGIIRHSLLESFIFCLLDDHSHEALLECHQLLPEISGPETHPKIAQVLLERQNPKAAQMVIRWSGRDGGSQMVSLSEAVTIVRVKVECALLTEAFAYQRMICKKGREKKFKYELSGDALDDMKGQCRSWMDWIEVLVTEFCCLCIRRNVVDQIIELPWNGEEEKYIHKCLLDCATDDPTSTIGSLLVVFYLQRYRYVEAYQVNCKLWSLEEDFISTHSGDENFLEALSSMESHRQRRKNLVDKGIELLPEVLQQQVRTGTLPDIVVTSHQEDELPTRTGFRELQEPKSESLLVPSSSDSIVLQPDHMATPLRPPVSEIPKTLGGYVSNAHVEAGTHVSTSILPGRLFADAERLSNVEGSKNFKFENILSPGIHCASPIFSTPLKGIGQSSSRELSSRRLREKQSDKIFSESKQNGFVNQVHNASPPYSRRVTANPASTPSSNFGLFKGLANNLQSNISGKRGQSDRDDGHRNVLRTEDLMDVSWSQGERSLEERNAQEGPRWRSDETSDDEEQNPDRTVEVGATPVRGRRRRFVRG
ncbi:E3 ubiquitin-protein ligase HOS1-like [Hibiscus syriacus]|uniref:E3 ubiquitin-protein ligase HOS1-like n=1 Tax=Hibiscus syriacus TaxID=106335 RepID=UPI001922AB49|nr:E3 ubiquitin-protein ligase HOS1-like [Hibiscus syriacus]XP_039022614.1 E3 ubiquitin-protein ligase HOS1-like [Hibiscus syriacus]